MLYPADSTPAGQELRLRQEFFFSSASLQDIVRRHLQQYGDLGSLPDKVAIQLNDTHPAIAIAELMRILVDLHGLKWAAAWKLTTRHLRLHQPHAAARGARDLAGGAARAAAAAADADHLRDQRRGADRGARALGFTDAQIANVSLIDEGGSRRVRMGQLAFVGSHSINGVSALHTELMKKTVFCRPQQALSRPDQQQDQRRDAAALADPVQSGADQADHRPHRHRSSSTTSTLLAELDAHADDPTFQEQFAAVKRANKAAARRS